MILFLREWKRNHQRSISIHFFIAKEDDPSEKVVTDQEELDGIDTDRIGILEDLPRKLFID